MCSMKWVYQTNMDSYGVTCRYKDRLVAKGLSQFQELDYTYTFSLVDKMESVRLVLDIVESKRWEVDHMDFNIYFLHGDIEEDIYL